MVGTDALWPRSPDRRGRDPAPAGPPSKLRPWNESQARRMPAPSVRRITRAGALTHVANVMCKTAKKCWTLRFAGYNSYMLHKVRHDSLDRNPDPADPRPNLDRARPPRRPCRPLGVRPRQEG